ncbi:hypothetical protein [Burkholderia sp. 22PA0106]|uniref:hypothetical protein n=1 Tax=Burkholderia sp. 22PA0106 TaxID=3237371 RepID=UPI0039C1D73F
MPTLIQKLHPALYPSTQLMLDNTRQPVFSQQGDWHAGSALHCAAMALAMLGYLPDPVNVRRYASGPAAHFWGQAWPHYLHGLTPSEFAAFVWELNAGVQPVQLRGLADELPRTCAQEFATGWPVVVWIANCRSGDQHATLVVGIEERDAIPQALLLLDPAGAAPILAACNARLEFHEPHASYITAEGDTSAKLGGAVSIRRLGARTTEAGCA